MAQQVQHLAERAKGSYNRRTEIETVLTRRLDVFGEALPTLSRQSPTFEAIASLLIAALRAGRKILVAGNGGSAAEAQHFAAELVGRFLRDRAPFAAIALTTDSSILTAVANDYDYEDVFARQVEALGRPGDVLVMFSTSGESRNLVRAADRARAQGVPVVAITGAHHSSLERMASYCVRIPAADTPIVQEMHMMVTHLLCGLVEEELAE
ncbi:MAG TPA: SIS domain-containing protein [Chloroflexota bacterium]|nr:SIS domain-containing protein [Chloroflexota bacterium]